MEWAGLAGLALTFILALVAFIRSYGEDLGGRRAWQKWVEVELKRHSEQHATHFDHQSDTAVHWTERERDVLQRQLDRIEGNVDRVEELIKESLLPRSQRRFRDPRSPGEKT